MATTTNYGWTTPNDTDLVKDGASAIRSLGTAIDTTVFNNAGAAIAKTIVDAKGDIIAATAADTVSRLAVGANDTVLTADSSTATGLKWAAPVSGGMTLLNSGGTALSSSSTTINITPTGYTSLKVYVKGVYQTGDDGMSMRLNGDTGNNYSYAIIRSGPSQVSNASTSSIFYLTQGSATSGTDVKVLSYVAMDIYNPTATDVVQIHHSSINGPSSDMRYTFGNGTYDCSAAITSLTFITVAGTFSGGTVYVYGVK